MTSRFVVSGTDTGIGKTVFAAALTRALDGCYWKPVQSGLEEETDSERVATLAALSSARIFPEAYRLSAPLSPHLSARLDGLEIDAETLVPPTTDRPLVIEGAGGLLVPLTEDLLFADVFARWQIPVILCARTSLGTINHTLLSIEAMYQRGIPLFGVAFIGDENIETERIIARFGKVRRLGRLASLQHLSPARLLEAFERGFDRASFSEMTS